MSSDVTESADVTESEIIARAQDRLLAKRSDLRTAEARVMPKRPGETDTVLALRHRGANNCAQCGRPVDHIGICADCGRQARVEAIADQVAPALASVPGAYDMRCENPELLRRVPSLAKELRTRGADPADFLKRPVLLLHGETGAGKSSLSGALFRFAVDKAAVDAIDADQDAVDFAARARWVEARDVPGDGAAVAWRASILVIDDVGQEGGTGESFACQDRQRIMADLLDKLYTHRVFGQSRGRIILTTYGTPELWRKWYGAGVARRYWEDADHVMKVELKR